MSKNKSQPKLSPENYIRTRARLLPIGECYINEGWKESGMAFITVTRRHVTGNLTIGGFQVDLYCLGIKNAFWYFNESPDIINEFKTAQIQDSEVEDKLILVNYELVHNIIYGAEAYAEELGFRPHREFELAQLILEEDDDSIPLIEIEFGLEGRPAVFIGPEKHPERIFEILNKSVGKDNYTIISGEDEFEDHIDDEEDNDEGDDQDLGHDRYIDKSIEEYNDQDFEDIVNGKRVMKPGDFFLFTYAIAQQNLKKKVKKELRRISKMIGKWNISEDDQSETQQFSTSAEEELYNKLYLQLEADPLETLPSIKKASMAYPDSFNMNNLLGIAHDRAEQYDEVKQVAENLFKRFPGNVIATDNYISQLILDEKLDEAEKIIHPGFDLHKQFPKQKIFTPLEFFTFLLVMINYHLAKNEILMAAAFTSGLTYFDWIDEQQSKAEYFYLIISDKLRLLFFPERLEDSSEE